MHFLKNKLSLLALNWSFSPFSCSGTLTACPSNASSCPVSTRSQHWVPYTWWRVMESCPGNAQQGKLGWILSPHGQGENDGKAPGCTKITKHLWLWSRRDEGEQSLSPLLCCSRFSPPAGLPCKPVGPWLPVPGAEVFAHHLLVPSAARVTVTSIRLLPRMSADLTVEPKSWPHPQPANRRGAGGGRYHLSITTCPGCSGGSTAKRWPWSPCIAITYPEISNSTSKVSGEFRYPSYRGGGWIKDSGSVQYKRLP